MKQKLPLPCCFLLALTPLVAQANFVNGDLSTATDLALAERSNNQIFPFATDIGGDGNNLDDGWISSGTNTAWTITGGKLVRTDNTRFSPLGVGQNFTNPGFATGSQVILSFDYNYTSDTPADFGLWGVPNSLPLVNNWLPFAGDSINLASATINLNNGDTGNYDLVELTKQTLGGASTNVSGTYQETITLTGDYDIFIFALASELNNTANRVGEFDNFSLAAVPEPAHVGLVLGCLAVPGLAIRRVRRMRS